MSDSQIPGEADALPRRSIDAAAYERRSRDGPCFIREMPAGNPDHAVAFPARYNTLLGHTLVAPRIHREQVPRRQANSRQGHAAA